MTYQLWQADFDIQIQFPHHGEFLHQVRPSAYAHLNQQRGSLCRTWCVLASEQERWAKMPHTRPPVCSQQLILQRQLLGAPLSKANLPPSHQLLSQCLLQLGELHIPPSQHRRGVGGQPFTVRFPTKGRSEAFVEFLIKSTRNCLTEQNKTKPHQSNKAICFQVLIKR